MSDACFIIVVGYLHWGNLHERFWRLQFVQYFLFNVKMLSFEIFVSGVPWIEYSRLLSVRSLALQQTLDTYAQISWQFVSVALKIRG